MSSTTSQKMARKATATLCIGDEYNEYVFDFDSGVLNKYPCDLEELMSSASPFFVLCLSQWTKLNMYSYDIHMVLI